MQLILRIRDQIEKGVLKHGEPLPTREKLMKEYDLSLSTVTRAISELERQGWLISRQGSGTFVVKKSEQSNESQPEIKSIGLLLPINRQDLQEFAVEFVHEALDHDLNTLISYSPEDEEQELNQARCLLELGVKALVWFPVEPKKHVSVASLFRKNRVPVIVGEKIIERIQAPELCIRPDYYAGAKEAINMLLDSGHTRIAYVGPKGAESDFGPIPERWNAYKETMRANGHWNPDDLIIHPSLFSEWHVQSSRIEVHFKRRNAPTAIVAFDDQIALEAIRGLQSIGLRVPEDVAVIGHGDTAAGRFSTPRLSTVSPNWSEYVDSLCRILVKQFESGDDAFTNINSREIVVSQRLIMRESTQMSDETITTGH